MAGYDDFSQPYDASSIYKQGMSYAPSSAPMDMGFDMGAVQGLGMDMGMGMTPQDPTLQGLQQYFPNEPQVPTPAFGSGGDTSGGGGSWFQRLFSSAVLGMSMGAGAHDPAQAFSIGYQSQAIQREQEMKMAQQMQQMKQQQEMFELNRAAKIGEIATMEFNMAQAPEELKRARAQSDMKMMLAMKKDGFEPDGAVDYSEEALKQAKEVSSSKPWLYDFFPDPASGKIYMYKADPNKILTKPYTSEIGGIIRTWKPEDGVSWSEIKSWENDQWKLYYQKQQDERNFQQSKELANLNASNQKDYFDYTQKAGPTPAQLGVQKREDVNNQIQFQQGQASQIGYEIKDLQNEYSRLQQEASINPKGVTQEMALRLQQIPEEINQLRSQIQGVNDQWSMLAYPQKPVSGTLPESIPFQDEMLKMIAPYVGQIVDLPPPYGRVKVLGVDPTTGQVQFQPIKTR